MHGEGSISSASTKLTVVFPPNTGITASALDVWVFVRFKRRDGRVSAYLFQSRGDFALRVKRSVVGLDAFTWLSVVARVNYDTWPKSVIDLIDRYTE